MDQNFSSFQNYQPGEDQEIPFVQVKDASYFRAKARNALKGKFFSLSLIVFLHLLIAVAISFVAVIVMVVGMLPSMLANPDAPVVINSAYLASMGVGYGVMLVGSVFLIAPLMAGLYRTCLELVDGKEIGTENLFCYFKKHYFKSVKLYVLYSLILFVASLPYYVFELAVLFGGLGGTVVDLVGYLCYGVSLVASVYVALRYVPSFFILAEYPEMRTVDLLRNSSAMMKGRKWKLFCLLFSFIGWIVLALVAGCCACGIGLLVTPAPLLAYVLPAAAAFYDDAANREAARQAEFPSLDPDDYKVEEEKTDEA